MDLKIKQKQQGEFVINSKVIKKPESTNVNSGFK